MEKWGFSIIHSIRGGDDGDMVFVWNCPVCILAVEPYLQQVFWKELKEAKLWRIGLSLVIVVQ